MTTKFGEVATSSFEPATFLGYRHVQTIWPKYFLNGPDVATKRERITTPDNDFLDLDWFVPQQPRAIVFALHGLEGSVASHYIKHLFNHLFNLKIGAVLMHFRGCSGEINLTPKAYHSGEVEDPLFALQYVQEQFPDTPMFAIGYSLGGNALLKLLANHQTNLVGAAAVCSPINLKASSVTINKGFAQVYQRHLLKSMKRKFIQKMQLVDMSQHVSVDSAQVESFSSFYEFDEHLTAPIHGYKGADDYYKRASAKPDLHRISTNTLIMHAEDDPFMDHQVIPSISDLSPSVAYEISAKGGHVGYMQRKEGRLSSYIPDRIEQFIEELL